jgi:WD40 repeat protein
MAMLLPPRRLLPAFCLLALLPRPAFGQPLRGPPGVLTRIEPVAGGGPPIHAVAVSDDNRFIAAVGGDCGVHVWERATGRPAAGLRGWSSVAFAPGAKLLATGNTGSDILLWQIPKGDEWLFRSGHSGGVNAAAFSGDGKLLATGSDDNTVRLWDVAEGKELRTLEGHEGLVGAVAVSADGRLVASASLDLTLRLWDAATGNALRRFEGHHAQVRGLAFSRDGKRLFSAGLDRAVIAWDMASGKELRRFGEHRQGVQGLSLSPDGKLLAAGDDDGSVRVWAVEDAQEKLSIKVHDFGVRSVAFTADGKGLVTGDAVGAVRLWDVRTGTQERTYIESHNTRRIHFVHALDFSPDGKTLAVGRADHSIRLHDAATGKELRMLGRQVDSVWAVAFSPDGRFVASAGRRDGGIHLWDVNTGAEVFRFGPAHKGGISRLSWSADGKLLASGGGSFDPSLHLWAAATGRHLWKMGGEDDFIDGLALSPDGRLLASAGRNGNLRLWDATRGTERPAPRDGRGTSVAFAANSRVLAWAGGDTAGLWDAVAGKPLGPIGPASPATAVFSPDGRTLALSSNDGHVGLWEVATGQCRLILFGHATQVHALAFRPDGRALAGAGVDGSVLIRDLVGLGPGDGGPLPEAELPALWQCLAGEDGATAYKAIWRLRAAPDQATALLRQRLRRPQTIPAERIERWVRDLDSDSYEVREKATRALAQAGDQAEAALRRALDSPSLEVRRRAEHLLQEIGAGGSPEEVRRLRAVEVLEGIGTPAARELLTSLARGAPGGRSARAAQDALDRLARRTKLPAALGNSSTK